MVGTTRSFNAQRSRILSVNVPSPGRIRELTLEIRKRWSSQTRANRTAVGMHRLELILASAQLHSDDQNSQVACTNERPRCASMIL